MKFFIPTIADDQVELFFNDTIVRFIESFGYKIKKEKRIYSLTFNHNGKKIKEIVGQASPSNNEAIFAILETDQLFLTCTLKRGITGGEPMIIGKHDVEDIEYFENNEKDIYKYGDWIYKLEDNNHKVEFLKKLPDSVYKYYNNNENSKDALLNQYLFCSHPFHLNDSMDSSDLLWDFSKITKKIFKSFFDYYKNNPFIQEEVSFEDDEKNSFNYIKSSFWKIVTDKSGIISLSENPLHTLMWSHYATEKGYMIEFDRQKLIERFKKNNPDMRNYVFMPIQYVNKLEKINFFSENFKTPDIPFLYSINIKKNDWEYENEWRFVCYSESYGVPNSILTHEKDHIGLLDRKFYYDKGIIKSFTLGKYFFNGSNIIDFKYPDTYTLKNDSDIEFVNYIFNNLNDNLYLSNELETDKKFSRNRLKIKLIKHNENEFQIVKI
ncbi:DUF2971 domain-containing protein [Lacinutrix sp. MEBiC02595]